MAVNDSVSVQRLRLSCSGGEEEELGLIVATAGQSPLPIRRQRQGDDLQKAIEANFDPNKRVDTDLRDLWTSSQN